MGQADKKPRFFGLDIIRAVAILSVLVAHGALLVGARIPYEKAVFPGFGFIGVELFFGLSGFLMGSILLERKYSLPVFYLKRLMKIVPPYFLILLVIWITARLAGLPSLVAHLLFVQNFFPDMVAYFPVSWSLAIEFWFYVLVPFLLLNHVAKKNIGRQVLGLSLAVLAAICLVRVLYVMFFGPTWELGIHRFIPLRFDTLICGVIAAIIVRQHKQLYDALTRPVVAIGNAAMLAGWTMLFGYLYHRGLIDTAGWFHSLGLTIVGINIAILILAALRYITYPTGWLAKPAQAVTFISLTSYSMYLVHLFVFFWIQRLSPAGGWQVYLVALIVSFVGAWILYETVEKWAVRASWYLQKRYFDREPLHNPALEKEVLRQP